MTRVTVNLPDDLSYSIVQLSTANQRSISNQIVWILLEYFRQNKPLQQPEGES